MDGHIEVFEAYHVDTLHSKSKLKIDYLI